MSLVVRAVDGDDGARSMPSPTGPTAANAPPTIGGVPPDPAAYDTERNSAARRRGLSTPYIPGGRDPDQEQAEREDRRYLRMLLLMAVIIVLFGFVVGIVAALLGLNGLIGRPA